MAKSKVNKSEKIRAALAAHPGMTPIEISAVLAAEGLKVPPQYISTIKSNAKAKARKGKRKPGAGRPKTPATGDFSSVQSALSFIKSSGGLEQAKATLKTIEQIGAIL